MTIEAQLDALCASGAPVKVAFLHGGIFLCAYGKLKAGTTGTHSYLNIDDRNFVAFCPADVHTVEAHTAHTRIELR